jgi:hypothetical protein
MDPVSATLTLDFPQEFKTLLFVFDIFLIVTMIVMSGTFLMGSVLGAIHCKYLNRRAYTAVD